MCSALAVASSKPVSGAQFVTAVALGVEIACRIALAAPRAFHARGLHPTGILTVFGSAAAAAWLIGARATVLRHALGMAGSFSSGLMQHFIDGTDQRYLHGGNAAAAGWLAARAAAEGIEGSEAAVDGRFGLFATHVPEAAPFDFAAVIAGLGTNWSCQSVSLKRYPTGYVTHPYIDAALRLASEPDFDPDAIERLTCVVPSNAVALVCEPRAEKSIPRNATLARISLPHMLAEAMTFRTINAKAFSAERLTDSRVRRLAARIDYAIVGAQSDERLVIEVRGKPPRDIPVRARSMTRDDIVAKFIGNAEPVFGETEARRLADDILMLSSKSRADAILGGVLRAMIAQTR